MQLFSVDQQRSQALEAHAAAFAQFKVRGCFSVPIFLMHYLMYYFALSVLIYFFDQLPGNENPSTLISFATKTLNAGQITSKLHVIELGAQPGKPALIYLFCCVVLWIAGSKLTFNFKILGFAIL